MNKSNTLYLLILILVSGCGLLPPRIPETKGDISGYEVFPSISNYSFYRPVSLAVDSPYVFIADEGNHNIAVFNWDLELIRTIGRDGEGPSEFSQLVAISSHDGVLVTLDNGNNRVSFLDYSGSFIQGFPLQFSNYGDISFTKSGSILVCYFNYESSELVKEFTADGRLLNQYVQKDINSNMRNRSRIVSKGDINICVFSYEPSIVIFGNTSSRWTYDYAKAYRWMRFNIRSKKKIERTSPGTTVALSFNGGGAIAENQLIVAGPYYCLRVIDINTGITQTVDVGPLFTDLMRHGPYTFDDIAIMADRLLLVSRDCSCLVILELQDVLNAAIKGKTLVPISLDR